MKILMTGANGFLGKYIYEYFSKDSENNLYRLGRGNFVEYKSDLAESVANIHDKFNLVIHVAGKAHSIPQDKSAANIFFKVNHIGTINLLEALSQNPPNTLVFISSVSVYGLEEGICINEESPLDAKDSYGKSKILAEQGVIEWANKHGVNYIILRLPLLIGKDAPGNLGAMINGIKKGYYFNINGGKAKRSMLLAEDVPKAIVHLLGNSGVFNLTDGYDPSYAEISNLIGAQLGKKVYSLPFFVCKLIALVGDIIPIIPLNSRKLKKLNKSLTFDSSIVRNKHGFIANRVLQNFKIN